MGQDEWPQFVSIHLVWPHLCACVWRRLVGQLDNRYASVGLVVGRCKLGGSDGLDVAARCRGVALWHRGLRWIIGLGLLFVAWLAMAQARTHSIQLLLSIFVVVWAADVFAYFFGRALGTKIFPRKLAPAVSPGKSWEGAVGGLLGVFVVALIWMQLAQSYQWPGTSLFAQMWQHGPFLWALSLIFLTAMSVVGDLVESLVKRSAGVKDSSNLLPGHGGVLDRLDALLPALPIAMMLLHWPQV